MTGRDPQPERLDTLLDALAEFRYHLRSFLQFSEQVAQDHHLRPRQHQLLLQIAGAPEGSVATINFLADRLGLRQNSLGELADRSEAEGLVRRVENPPPGGGRGCRFPRKGCRWWTRWRPAHARELDEFGPQLIRALERI